MADLPGTSEERQLALLVSSATEYAIFMLDPDGRVLTWNAGAERLNGYDRGEIVGQHFSVFYTDEDRARDHPARELELALRDGSYEEEGWRLRKDGSRFWASVVITAVYDPDGAHIGFGNVSRDLTTRRMAEERSQARAADLELANEELSEFRRLVSSVRDYAIFMLDPGGHIRSWNVGARRLKGYEPEEIIGQHFSVFYSAEDKARDHPAHELRLAVRDGRYEEEGWRLRKDGSTFWAGVTITAIRDDEGRLTGFAKVTRDLTERKQAEDALREAVEQLSRANRELDRFASVAAHDMTDPLRTISGFAELIVSGHRSAEENLQYAEHIHSSSLRLGDMLQRLLSYARAGHATASREPVALGPAVAEVLSDLTGLIADSGAAVNVEIDPGATVWATPGDVRTVLQNLISNAVKFGDPHAPVVDIAAEPADDGTLRVTVEDNGAGVAEADRGRVFGAFERAGPGAGQTGYGLGLAICQRLVSRHGGQIGIEGGREGACLWFRIPVPPAQTVAEPEA